MTAFRRAQIRRLGEQGMTLVELMIVLLILSLTSSAMFSLLLTSFKVYWKGDAATQAQQGARISTDRMVRDLRQARRLINGVTETVGSTSVTFNTGCTTPQVSFALPHLASITLADGSTVYDTDPNASGTIPYDGSYVSYYLAASSNSATPNTAGPYLIRASYDLVGNTLTVATVAGNITGLALNPSGTCPTTATREFTVQVTAVQNQTGQNVSSKTIITDDVTLRNQ
jgi:prepilin-type N-terminal cleavage/methylation domain-containing protein